jgi:imidazolonepropionase-like amidohydrolase
MGIEAPEQRTDPPVGQGRTVFTHANLLDGENAAKPDFTVVVEHGRITQVANGNGAGGNGADGDAVEIAPDDQVIDCTGLTLMPGMTQGHYHSTYHNITVPIMPPLGLESPPAYQAYVAAYNVGLALKCGITSVVGANEAWDVDPSLKQAIFDGLVVGPRVIAGSREIITTADSNDVTPWYWESKALGGTRMADGPDEFRKAVRDEIKRGAEVIKLFVTGGHGVRLSRHTSSITVEELNAVTDAAHALGARVRAHVASKEGIMKCLDAEVDIIDHGDGIDEECIERMAEQKACYEPSVYSLYLACMAPEFYDPEFKTEFGQVMLSTCAMLPKCVEAGVYVNLADDYGGWLQPHGTYGGEPGFYHDFTGIDALEILKWATVNGGKLVGLDDLGRIEEGYIADIVLVNGDPSEDIHILADTHNIVLVMRDGQIFVDNYDKAARPVREAVPA